MMLKLLLPVAAIVFSVPLPTLKEEVAVPLPMEKDAFERERYIEFQLHLNAPSEEDRLAELDLELQETLKAIEDLDEVMREMEQERARLLEYSILLHRELHGDAMWNITKRPAPRER